MMGSVKMFLRLGLCTFFLLSLLYDLSACKEKAEERTAVIKLWSEDKPAFGVIAPNEREPGAVGPDGAPLPPLYTQAGGERLAQNELLDFVIQDLEHDWADLDMVTPIVSGLESGKEKGGGEKSVLLRIKPIWQDGEEAARERVGMALALGADGIVFPMVRSAEMARTAVSFFTEIGADVWGPQNPDGTVIAFLMIEDPAALAEVEEIANVPGYSVLACGIDSLTEALGDREAAEAGNQLVLEHAKRTGHPSVALVGPDVADRIDQGFLGLLADSCPYWNENLWIGHKYLETGERVEQRTTVIKLWSQDKPAFGVIAPNEREPGAVGPDGASLPPLYTQAGGERLAHNELLDFVFLNLENGYAFDAVTAIVAGLESGKAKGGDKKSLLVRIPPIAADGEETARQRVAEVIAAGADGIVIPHVGSAETARTAVSFFTEIGADVWGPQNPDGTIIAFFMVEDPDALAEVEEIANVPGYSVLACGLGSLTQELGGDREAAEAGNLEVLAHAKRTGHPNVVIADDNVTERIDQGFLGLLMHGGPDADEDIGIGREHLNSRVTPPPKYAAAEAAADKGGTGPYPAVMTSDPTLPTHTVYRPADLAAAAKDVPLPIIAWGNDGCKNCGDLYRYFLTEIASHGYFIVATGPIGPPGLRWQRAEPGSSTSVELFKAQGQRVAKTLPGHLNVAIDWAITENDRLDSEYFGMLDPESIGVMGMSCGGLQAITAAADPRVKTLMAWTTGTWPEGMKAPGGGVSTKASLKYLHTPVAYISIYSENSFGYSNAVADYEALTVPVLHAVRHNISYAADEPYRQPNGGEFAKVGIAWLDWILKGDEDASRMFMGTNCTLCTDENWDIVHKGW